LAEELYAPPSLELTYTRTPVTAARGLGIPEIVGTPVRSPVRRCLWELTARVLPLAWSGSARPADAEWAA
jgi:hypothetical protein